MAIHQVPRRVAPERGFITALLKMDIFKAKKYKTRTCAISSNCIVAGALAGALHVDTRGSIRHTFTPVV